MSDDSNTSIDQENTNTDLEVIIEGDENEAAGETEPVEVQEEGSDEEKTIVKPKKRILKPRVKLNAETLKSNKGIAALPSYFERVKFKGVGQEEKDLNVLLKTYEYWCHRLFPKYPFDDCIAKIEKLGSKKEVQTHIKRVRMDLLMDNNEPIPDEDNIQEDDDTPVNRLAEPEITDEQLERIRLNKERAERIRWERLRQTQQQNVTNLSSPNEFPTSEEIEEINNSSVVNSEIESNREENFPTAEELDDHRTSINDETEQNIDDMLEEIQKVNQE